MSATYTRHVLELATLLPPDTLLLKSIEGKEAISRLFVFKLTLQSQSRTIDAAALVGKRITVQIALDPDNSRHRYYNGIVCRFLQSIAIKEVA